MSAEEKVVVFPNDIKMELDDDSFIESPRLEPSTVMLSEDVTVCEYIMPQEVTDTTFVISGASNDEVKLELGSWDTHGDKYSVSSLSQDSGIDSDHGTDVFLTLVEDSMPLLKSQNKEDIVMSEKIYEMDDVFLVEQSQDTEDVSSDAKSADVGFIPEEIHSADEDQELQTLSSTSAEDPPESKTANNCMYHVVAYHCTDCSKSFYSKSLFHNHMEEHLIKLQNSCAVCNAQFNTKTELQNHIRAHFKKKSNCDMCGKTYLSRSSLRAHKFNSHCNSSNKESVTSLKCRFCSQIFTTKSDLKEHSLAHSNAKSYVCNECGATFTQNGSLQVHLRRHRGEKPFSCELCGNRFTRAHSLKVHMRSHTGEKSHTCGYCGAAFVTSSHLTVHIRTHTGERPYSCNDCGATFITTSHLNVHRRVHAGACGSFDTPRTCTQCSEMFNNSGDLRQHRRSRHRNSVDAFPVMCVKCDKKFSTQHQLNKHLTQGCG